MTNINYTAINHATGEILECSNLKTLWKIITSERRWDKREGRAHEPWTIHKGCYSQCTTAFYSFPGILPDGVDQCAWAF